MTGCKWTPEEEEKLRKMWPHALKNNILEEFYPRTWEALRERASIIGAKRGHTQGLNNIMKRQAELKAKQGMI